MHSSRKCPCVGFSLKGRKMWGLVGDWSGRGGCDRIPQKGPKMGGCPQGFWLGMSFAEDATFGLKSLNFLQAGQAGGMRGKVAKIQFFEI